MALTITYWTNFSKRINSTKQPTSGTNISTVALKTPCSIETPVFILNGISDSINYIKWGSRYYYVTDVTWLTNDNIQVSCDLDVLATYKSNILSTKAFVEYSQSDYNAYILDPRISNSAQVLSSYTTNLALNSLTSSEGTYILSVVGEDGLAVRYAMSKANMDALGLYMSTQITDTVADQIAKRFGDVYGCILGCTWIPFGMSTGGPETVHLGNINTNVPGSKITGLTTHNITTTLSISYNHSEYCRQDTERIILSLPGYGQAALNPAEIKYATSLDMRITADITGGLLYALNSNEKHYTYYVNVGVEVPITKFTTSVAGMFLNNLATLPAGRNLPEIGGVGSSEAISALYGNGAMANIVGKLRAIGSSASCSGGQGGVVGAYDLRLYDTIKVHTFSYAFTETQANMADRYGRPLYAVRTLSTLTGYVKTNGASVDIPGYEEEKNKVCALLNGGIFIE